MAIIERAPLLVDDLDGTTDEQKPIETRDFALDGVDYKIDLTEDNYTQLKESFERFIAVARTTPKARPLTSAPLRGARMDRAQLDAIREWARARGMEVSKYGRIPGHIKEAYEQLAHPSNRERAMAENLFSAR